MKGITLKICLECVYVIINKYSFESFMCLDPGKAAWISCKKLKK